MKPETFEDLVKRISDTLPYEPDYLVLFANRLKAEIEAPLLAELERLKSILGLDWNMYEAAQDSLREAQLRIKQLESERETWSKAGDDVIAELQDELAEAKREMPADILLAVSRAQKRLGELLCIIHRDGGQYIDEHGYEKAFADAIDAVLQWRDAADAGKNEPSSEGHDSVFGEVGELLRSEFAKDVPTNTLEKYR